MKQVFTIMLQHIHKSHKLELWKQNAKLYIISGKDTELSQKWNITVRVQQQNHS